MADKIVTGIIGPGNIGSDLMLKLLDSEVIDNRYMFGVDPDSNGMKLAREKGLETFAGGIDDIRSIPEEERPEILFDATSANVHKYDWGVAEELGIRMIDLTPAAIGPFVSPAVNIDEHIDTQNVNMVTCGGQATTPIVAAINSVHPVEYAEIVSTISSKSAGPGTRANIDEFTETTAKALEDLGGAKKGKAIMILNPAEPPILMRNTIYSLVEGDSLDEEAVKQAILDRVEVIKSYVPGYRLRQEPIFDGNQVTVFIEVEGEGMFLPVYSGNLDIMTAAARGVGERMAEKMLQDKENAEVK